MPPPSDLLAQYGATGSGKTYTMSGTPDNPGVIYLLIKDLFAAIADRMAAAAAGELVCVRSGARPVRARRALARAGD